MNQFKAPWEKYYGTVPMHLTYPEGSMYDYLKQSADQYPEITAYEFMGRETSYNVFLQEIDTCARGLRALGIGEDDKITICMPNMPQAVMLFYAINKIGALANMIHPLSSPGEIEFFLNHSQSTAALVLDAFCGKVMDIRKNTSLKHLIVTSTKDKLSTLQSIGFELTRGRKIPAVPREQGVILWRDFLKKGDQYKGETYVKRKDTDPAVILYSGGTTGTTKGVLLSNLNFNAMAMQTVAMGDCIVPGHAMLAIMPIFHGFGLGVCVHTMLTNACKCILIPKFDAKSFGELLKKKQPNYIAGVPTLYEALLRNESMKGVDLACLEGVFSGGDSLSVELKKKADAFLHEHGARIQIREGYGATECVTASCLTPKDYAREGSIGIPFPDTYYKIVAPHTHQEQPCGTEGEICIAGPSVMLGYVGDPKETSHTLQIHDDGHIWLHTGDLGVMDEDGFIYFRQRLKRMIVSSGYSIYPSQLENVIDAHESVLMSTVIGVDDPYKIQKVKAYVVLKPDVQPTEDVKKSVEAHCRRNIAKYAFPYEFEYRESLPQTKVGKIAFTVLEAEAREQEKAKRQNKEAEI